MPRRWWMPWMALPAWLVAMAATAAVPGCRPAASSPAASGAKPPPPVTIKPPTEAELATVILTPEAEKRLGITLVAVERKPVPHTATYGGEAIIPPGRLVTVSSPFTGTLNVPPASGLLAPGVPVKEGQTVFILVPILSPEARATMAPMLIEAEGQIKQGKESLKIAKVNLDRAENLMRDKLGGSAALVDARAQFDLAQATLRAAESRREILAKVAADADSGVSSSQKITAPAGGTLQNLHARPGQKVAAGALLFDVASLDPIWIKVPVYVGDLDRIATDKEAAVGGLSGIPGAATRPAAPVAAPPSGDPLAATVNLFYELANPAGTLRPGQRVGVTVPLRGEDQSLVVPVAALLRDIHGNTWVYENNAPHAYTRRRVSVDRVVDHSAALASGPKPGARIVTDGAAELFGSEFHVGK